HKPITVPAVFSFLAPDIYHAHRELKLKGANVDDEIGRFGAHILGFHVIDSEGNSILIVDRTEDIEG
ncbi:hypothetical protein, partial [Pseudomonas sp. 2822-17]|uniref:hypothetical protein n=1 Tax=Pseudomonas sp. 2822-17 TaxID=1712678 RepID=UPI001C45EE00